jgi:peptidylprolyl isomerase
MAEERKRPAPKSSEGEDERRAVLVQAKAMPTHVPWGIASAVVLALFAIGLAAAALVFHFTEEDAAGEPTVTSSGLQYIDITVGTGASPEAGQTLVVHYTGWLTDGTKVHSSIDQGEPLSFTLGADELIDGFEEGVATMKVGGKRRLIIPPELAYGESGVSPDIPPNAVLIYDVELIEIQ